MKRKQCIWMGVWLAGLTMAQAQQETTLPMEQAYKRTYQIQKVSGQRPTIDGRLDEDFWEQGTWTADFVQVNGKPLPLLPVPNYFMMTAIFMSVSIARMPLPNR